MLNPTIYNQSSMFGKICCFSTDFCKGQCIGLTRNKNIKLAYVSFIVLAAISTETINSIMGSPSSDTIINYGCESATHQQQCVHEKVSSVIFTGLALLHLLLLFCMFLKTQKVKIINEGIWLIKIGIVALFALIMRFIVSTSFFQFLETASVWVSVCFYVFESIVFVDFAYNLDIKLTEKAAENTKIHVVKAIVSILVFGCSIFLCYCNFYQSLSFVAISNSVALGLFLIVALLRVFPGNSIFVYSFVMLYATLTGLYVKNDVSEDNLSFSKFLWINKIFNVLFLLFAMLGEGSNKLRTQKSSITELLALNTSRQQQDNRYVSSNKWTIYHAVMMLIVFGLPAVLCFHHENQSQSGQLGLHVTSIVWWASGILAYVWSLVCSKLYPEKDFSELENYFKEFELN